MKNLLKIIYSSNILTKYSNITNDKINILKKKNYPTLKINNNKDFNNILNDIITPIDELYDYELVFSKNVYFIRLTINFTEIKNIIQQGYILPCRNKLFKVLSNYKKNLDSKFYSNINNLIINDVNGIEKKFMELSKKNSKILNKNLFELNDIIFNLDSKRISFDKEYLKYNKDLTYGGIIIDENEYGKYLNSNELPLNNILLKNEEPSYENLNNFRFFVNSKNSNKINNLIVVSNTRLFYWKNFLKDKKALIVNNINIFKKLHYIDVFNYDYVIITLNVLNNSYYKSKFEEYNVVSNFCIYYSFLRMYQSLSNS